MKRIAIGRGRECDIRIKDSSDKISRKQCVITTTFTGRMRIYDTSANGTFLNGERVPIPDGCPIKKGDSVNFAHTTDFDWSTWKDPYRAWKVMIVTLLAAAVVIVVLFFLLADQITKKSVKEEVPEEPKQELVAADTVVSAKIVSPITDAPAVIPEPQANPGNKKVRDRNKDKNTDNSVKDNDSEPAEEQTVSPDPRLNNNGTGGDISDEELNKRRKM